jgi:hypothetical protein
MYHTLGEMGNTYRFLVENPEGKRPLGSSRRRWEGNINMCLKEIKLEYVQWIIWLRVGPSVWLL